MEYKKLVHGLGEILEGSEITAVEEAGKILQWIIEKDGLDNEEVFDKLPLRVQTEFLRLGMMRKEVVDNLTDGERNLLRAEFRG